MSATENSDSEELATASSTESGDQSTDSEEIVVRAENVTKHFGGIVAIDGIDLEIKQNEILAFVGDNGAGKSTFMKSLSGVLPITEGDFYLEDGNGGMKRANLGSASDAREMGIETVFQDRSLSGQHDVAANVFMGREPLKDDISGRLFRRIDREFMEKASVDALDQIGFNIDPSAETENLSGGQQQAVAVARALISDPNVIILDEPTAEVSASGSQKILDLINRLKEAGKTVVFVTHNMDEVVEVADRIVVLRQGKLAGILENDGSVKAEELVAYMTGAAQVESEQDDPA